MTLEWVSSRRSFLSPLPPVSLRFPRESGGPGLSTLMQRPFPVGLGPRFRGEIGGTGRP
jgi:hypothetical protein